MEKVPSCGVDGRTARAESGEAGRSYTCGATSPRLTPGRTAARRLVPPFPSEASTETFLYACTRLVGKPVQGKRSVFRELFDSLPRTKDSKVKDLWGHQEEVLSMFETNALDKAMVGIELPTGAGKSLIALLIAEY